MLANHHVTQDITQTPATCVSNVLALAKSALEILLHVQPAILPPICLEIHVFRHVQLELMVMELPNLVWLALTAALIAQVELFVEIAIPTL